MKKFETVDEYIESVQPDAQKKLKQIRKAAKEVSKKLQEAIKWGMPTIRYQDQNLLYYAAAKKHIGFYPLPGAIKHFEKELAQYKHAKGTMRFPMDKPIPTELIKKITRFRIKEIDQDLKHKSTSKNR